METKDWKEKLLYQPKNGWERTDAAQEAAMEGLLPGLQGVSGRGQDRAAVRPGGHPPGGGERVQALYPGMAVKPGDKVYYNNRGKMLLLAVIESERWITAPRSPPPISTAPAWT